MAASPLSILSAVDFNGDPLREDILNRTFGELMSEHGYVLLCNVPDGFDYVGFCRSLGAFIPNYSGAVVGDVRPEPGMDDVYHAGNTRNLTPHTEGYDFTITPPRYVALWCVTPCLGGGGETTLADAYTWLATLTDSERASLSDTPFAWKTTEGIQRLGLDLHTTHPVIEDHPAGTIFRFSCNNLDHGDSAEVQALQTRAHQHFDDTHVAIEYHKNDLLIWDNWRMMHSRNAFNDRGRHLRRIQIAQSAVAPVTSTLERVEVAQSGSR